MADVELFSADDAERVRAAVMAALPRDAKLGIVVPVLTQVLGDLIVVSSRGPDSAKACSRIVADALMEHVEREVMENGR